MVKKRVMLVDDEKDFIMIAKLNLEMSGIYEVITLSIAEYIISQVQKFNPDIILLDILMPKISGADACRMLKDDPKTAKIPIISISALDTDKDSQAMHELGAADFLTKPVEKNDIIAKIEKVLKSK